MVMPCEHLKKSDRKYWCNGIEYFWEDCCKYYPDRRYKVDEYCHDINLSNKLFEEERDRERLEKPIAFGC